MGFSYTYEPPHHQITAGTGSPQGTAGQPARAAASPAPWVLLAASTVSARAQ